MAENVEAVGSAESEGAEPSRGEGRVFAGRRMQRREYWSDDWGNRGRAAQMPLATGSTASGEGLEESSERGAESPRMEESAEIPGVVAGLGFCGYGN